MNIHSSAYNLFLLIKQVVVGNGFLNVKKIFSHTIFLCDDLYGQPGGPETPLASE